MKIKGLRWYIIGLIMMITIINYLDRGTLNYMWVANIDYELVEKQPIDMSSNVAVKTDKGYRLFSTRGDDMIVDEGATIQIVDDGYHHDKSDDIPSQSFYFHALITLKSLPSSD
jgi:ACS family hexuronate transporter-like MFS transporter